MKKIILLNLAILICMITYAQIDNPKINLLDLPAIQKQLAAPDINQMQINPDHIKGNSRGFDPVWADRFQSVLDNVMQSTNSKGASIAVYAPDEGLWTGVSGTSYGTIDITPDMRFGIGSNTKLFVAVTVLRLHEEGILSLEDHLYQWLPSYQYIDSSTTIRQLLAHESGIYDYWNDQPSLIDSVWADTSRFWTSEEIIASIGPPHFSPGTGYRYSNTNYVLAGMIIEEATGETWVQNIHTYVFDPLGLDSTFVGAFEPRNGPVAAEWDIFSGILIPNPPMTAEYSQANACGAILGTAAEMVQWYKALLGGSVLTNSSLQLLLSFEPASLFGLGIIAGGEEVLFYYHTGGMMGFVSMILYDVRRESIIAMLFNDRESNFGTKANALLGVFFGEYPTRTNDAGIVDIIAPWEHYCDTALIPEVELMNFGDEPLTSVSIYFKVDEGTASVFEWSGSLASGVSTQVVLPSIISGEGAHSFCCYTSSPNGEPEGYSFNDTLRSNFYINASIPVISGLFEGFEENSFPPDGWTLGSSTIYQWNKTMISRHSGNGSCVKNNSDVNGIYGAYSDMQLPLLNISNLYNTEFSFDYAYTHYPGWYEDSLQISVSEDCGATWQTLFHKGGYTLRTRLPILYYYYPTSLNEWQHESFSLSEFEGDILIRFRARYGASNNLFIDNIQIGSPVSVEEPAGIGDEGLSVICYPNPSADAMCLRYMIHDIRYVTCELFDISGRKIKRLKDENQLPGEYEVEIDVSGLPSGVYFIRLQAGQEIAVRKLIVID